VFWLILIVPTHTSPKALAKLNLTMLKYIDDNDILKLDTNLFLPLLNDVLVAHNLPMELTNPLTPTNFSDMKLSNIITNILDDITFFLKHGFNNNDPTNHLSKEQWFCTASQTIAAIYQGLYKLFPVDNARTFIDGLGPNRDKAMHSLVLATSTLHYFFTNPLTNSNDK
jgi:hypothetical protein